MKKDEFRKWLEEIDGRSKAQVSDHISRVKRIEDAITLYECKKCDVDKECAKDNAYKRLEKLSLNSRRQMPYDINLPEDQMGMARLRSSLRKYIEFYNWMSSQK